MEHFQQEKWVSSWAKRSSETLPKPIIPPRPPPPSDPLLLLAAALVSSSCWLFQGMHPAGGHKAPQSYESWHHWAHTVKSTGLHDYVTAPNWSEENSAEHFDPVCQFPKPQHRTTTAETKKAFHQEQCFKTMPIPTAVESQRFSTFGWQLGKRTHTRDWPMNQEVPGSNLTSAMNSWWPQARHFALSPLSEIGE